MLGRSMIFFDFNEGYENSVDVLVPHSHYVPTFDEKKPSFTYKETQIYLHV